MPVRSGSGNRVVLRVIDSVRRTSRGFESIVRLSQKRFNILVDPFHDYGRIVTLSEGRGSRSHERTTFLQDRPLVSGVA